MITDDGAVDLAKLDTLASNLRDQSGADGIVICVMHRRGMVFAASADPNLVCTLPSALSYLAHQIAHQVELERHEVEEEAPEGKAN